MSKKTLKNLTILIVEDEQDTRNIMVDALKDVFLNVIVAQNGSEGIKKFKKYNPNIILTDISMPIVDGLELTKKIKDISPETPIIALSAFSEKQKLLKAIEVGINKYILKPVDMEELLESIEELAKNKFEASNDINLGDGYVFNQMKKILYKDGVEIQLTKKELAFISLLTTKLGIVVSMDEIKENVWFGEKVNDAAIRTFVKRVRDKVGQDMIKNLSGIGYKIEVK